MRAVGEEPRRGDRPRRPDRVRAQAGRQLRQRARQVPRRSAVGVDHLAVDRRDVHAPVGGLQRRDRDLVLLAELRQHADDPRVDPPGVDLGDPWSVEHDVLVRQQRERLGRRRDARGPRPAASPPGAPSAATGRRPPPEAHRPAASSRAPRRATMHPRVHRRPAGRGRSRGGRQRRVAALGATAAGEPPGEPPRGAGEAPRLAALGQCALDRAVLRHRVLGRDRDRPGRHVAGSAVALRRARQGVRAGDAARRLVERVRGCFLLRAFRRLGGVLVGDLLGRVRGGVVLGLLWAPSEPRPPSPWAHPPARPRVARRRAGEAPTAPHPRRRAERCPRRRPGPPPARPAGPRHPARPRPPARSRPRPEQRPVRPAPVRPGPPARRRRHRRQAWRSRADPRARRRRRRGSATPSGPAGRSPRTARCRRPPSPRPSSRRPARTWTRGCPACGRPCHRPWTSPGRAGRARPRGRRPPGRGGTARGSSGRRATARSAGRRRPLRSARSPSPT